MVAVTRQMISREQPQHIANSTVSEWLHGLQLGAYTDLFHAAGYTTVDDLTDVNAADLEHIGITSAVHQQLLLYSIDNIRETIDSQSSAI